MPSVCNVTVPFVPVSVTVTYELSWLIMLLSANSNAFAPLFTFTIFPPALVKLAGVSDNATNVSAAVN